jgi:16S rRNA (cytosine1402-N4)-methyltransferase
MRHISVLLQESIDALQIKEGGVYVDGTLGSGGHSEAIAKMNIPVTIIGIDADADALRRSQKKLAPYKHITLHTVESYNDTLSEILLSLEITTVDGILLDLGMSSDQLEESKRGFSFQKDEPLLMTMREQESEDALTAASLINKASEDDIATILYNYADEQFSKRIAKSIIQARELEPIETTSQLVEIIIAAVPPFYRKRKTHPATKTFQALRIAVNDEMTRLHSVLEQSMHCLKEGGVLSVITFHSLEDRIVKRFMRQQDVEGNGKLVSRRAIKPTEEEVKENPRSRSALLRVLTKK